MWITSLDPWQLTPELCGDVQPHQWSLLLDPVYRLWLWLACNVPFLWAGQRWLELSCSYHPSSWLRLEGVWQSPLTVTSTDELERTKIGDLRMVCGKLPLKPSKRHSPWRRPRRLVVALASSTFWLSALEFSLYRNGLQGDRRGACLLAPSKWLLRHTEGLDNGEPARFLLSPPTFPLTSTSWSLYYHPGAYEVSFSCLRCW